MPTIIRRTSPTKVDISVEGVRSVTSGHLPDTTKYTRHDTICQIWNGARKMRFDKDPNRGRSEIYANRRNGDVPTLDDAVLD